MKRTSIALLSSAWVFALFLMAAVPATPAYAGDNADCEDGSCPTGNIPSEGESLGDVTVFDEEFGDDNSEGDSSDDVDDSGESESGSGSEGGQKK